MSVNLEQVLRNILDDEKISSEEEEAIQSALAMIKTTGSISLSGRMVLEKIVKKYRPNYSDVEFSI